MGAVGEYMKMAVRALENTMNDLGKEVKNYEIADIVSQHAIGGAISGAGAALLPGAGALVAMGAAGASVLTMYVRLSKSLGVTLNEGTMRALVSGVVADVSSVVITNLALSAVVSFIPGFGQAGSAALNIIANYTVVYISAYIFIKMLTALFSSGKKIDSMTEEEIVSAASDASSGIDMRNMVKEAKTQYNKNK